VSVVADLDMTPEQREAFLADLHVGILSIQRDGKGPLALPIWYQYEAGQVVIHMAGDSVKAKLLRRHGRASMTVQDERPPYRYVMVEGPVTLAHEDRDILAMAVRYLGDEMGRQYADANQGSADSVVARLTPERWLSTDYSAAR
jgi:PPOX class probable F420-dependent enzyme